MIHVGMQYAALLKNTVADVASARLALAVAEHDACEAERDAATARIAATEAREAYDAAKSILEIRLLRDPAEAVRQFHADTGRYPI